LNEDLLWDTGRKEKLTSAKRQISVPLDISVKSTSSDTQVMILVASGVMAIGPEECNGLIARAFLKLV